MINLLRQSFIFARDSSIRRTLNFFNSSCKRASPVAMICAARMPALRPPLMATVATGTPGGICTMDSSESSPSKDLPKIGTPMTGKVVNAAVTPGRCAAPPAPQMITFSPRDRAGNVFFQAMRIAMRGNDFGFAGDAEFLQRIGGGFHGGPVGIAAHQNTDERFVARLFDILAG